MGAIAARWAEQLVGRVIAGRYILDGLLGLGGMGAVFAATQTAIRRDVAVKILTPTLADRGDFVERFRREATLAAQASARGTPAIIDFDRDAEVGPFLVMERLYGESLEDRLDRERKLPLEHGVRIASAALATLSAVHARGIVHRDLKPANLFLTRDEEVKILDFGIARMVAPTDDGLTQPGALLGTPRYMAREQALGARDVDLRADLYAMGAILYRCFAGEAPYAQLSVEKGLVAIGAGELPEPLGKLRPDLPDAIVAAIERAMASSKLARYANAGAMREALEAALEGRPHDALPATAPGGRAPRAAPVSAPPTAGASTSLDAAAIATVQPGRETRESEPPPAAPSAPPEGPRPLTPVAAPLVVPAGPTLVSAVKPTPAEPPVTASKASRRGIWAAVAVLGAVAAGAVVFLATRTRTPERGETILSVSRAPSTTSAPTIPREAPSVAASAAPADDDATTLARIDSLLRGLPPASDRSPDQRDLASDLYLLQGHLQEKRMDLPDRGALSDAQKQRVAEGATKMHAGYVNARATPGYAACAALGQARVAELEARAREAGATTSDSRAEALRALEAARRSTDDQRRDPFDGSDCRAMLAPTIERLQRSLGGAAQ